MNKKNLLFIGLMLIVSVLLAGCADGGTTETTTTDTPVAGDTTPAPEVAEEASTDPVQFADLHMGLMDAKDEYTLFTFEEGEGTCLEQGFPTDLVYSGPDNMVKTVDESYVEDWTSIDFVGNLRFDEVPLEGGDAACVIKVSSGVTKVTLTCSRGEDDAEEEVCEGTFKLYAEK